ncbi:MAG: 3,4-dihydroxy-2-butanone-4-phosphate synthase [Candidatus Poseidoniales archaeon]|nr:3,4-dihydroxy-2-butanone-4-phosphate synthase [Marine Group III euryarchaeote]
MSSKIEIEKIKVELLKGNPIFVFDEEGRESETDIFFYAKSVTKDNLHYLRKNGGGMIFLASEYSISRKLGLPFMEEIYDAASSNSDDFGILNIMKSHSLPYTKSKSSFSIFINHKDTFTGITDEDRSLTARSFLEVAEKINNLTTDESKKLMGNSFRSPGHVPVCIAASEGLSERQGHTELITELFKKLNLTPIALGCEMVSKSGKSLSRSEAENFAKDNGYLFLEGQYVKEVCL